MRFSFPIPSSRLSCLPRLYTCSIRAITFDSHSRAHAIWPVPPRMRREPSFPCLRVDLNQHQRGEGTPTTSLRWVGICLVQHLTWSSRHQIPTLRMTRKRQLCLRTCGVTGPTYLLIWRACLWPHFQPSIREGRATPCAILYLVLISWIPTSQSLSFPTIPIPKIT